MWGNVCRVYDRAVRSYHDRIAIVDGDRRVTYGEMGAHTNRVARGLAEIGVRKGDRVGLLMPNRYEFIPTLYGIWKAGAAFTQMPTRAAPDDFRYYLNEVEAGTLIYDAAFDDAVAKIRAEIPSVQRIVRLGEGPPPVEALDYRDLFDRQASDDLDADIAHTDIALAGFTAGTTGMAKAVLIDHANWAHYAITAGLEMGDIRPGEVFGHIAPLTHFSLSFVLPTFMRGGTNVVLPGLDLAAFLTAIATERITATALVPTIIYILLDLPDRSTIDFSSLRTIVYAASPMVPERLRQALEVFGPIFVQGYGGTEPGYISCLRKEDHSVESAEGVRRLGSAGRPMYHVDVQIQDDGDRPLPAGEIGEISVRSPGQMVRYWDATRNAEAVRAGWVHSGDIGYLDDDGFLTIVDRKKDMVITGGFNVFPRQIEDVLATHPAVAQSAVFGVPDDKWGEAVRACIVLRPGSEASADELIALVKERKGSVWAPKSIEFVESIPLTPAGKPDKKALRAPYWAGQERGVH